MKGVFFLRRDRYNRVCGYCGMYENATPAPLAERRLTNFADDTDYMVDVDGCGRESDALCPNLNLAIATVPMQTWTGNAFEDDAALAHGTVFPELVLPFTGGRCI